MKSPRNQQPWFQFRLRTLFVVVAVVGVITAYGANWYRLQLHARVAHRELERMQAAYDAGVEELKTPMDAYRNWCLAENSVPFADQRAACQSYLDYIDYFQGRLEGSFRTTLYHDLESARHELEQNLVKIKEYRQEANQWLAAGKASSKPTIIHSWSESCSEK